MNKEDKVFPMLDTNKSYADGKRLSIKNDGITARDYIAIKAMQGLLSSGDSNTVPDMWDIARMAYRAADAMIEESNQDSEDSEE